MSSLTTNTFALGALTVLRGVTKDLGDVQQQVSSGYKIQTASDNPSYWSMANTMRSDSASLKTIGDAMSLGASKVDTAYTATDTVVDLLTQIQAKLVSAKEAGVNKTQINTDIQSLKGQLETTIESASFSGDNWLYNTASSASATRSVVNNFVRGTNGSVSLTTVDYDATQSLFIDTADPSRGLLTKEVDANTLSSDGTGTARNYYMIATGTSGSTTDGTEIALGNDTTDAEISDMISVTGSLLKSATAAASTMGIMKDRIDQQSSYVTSLQTDIDTSVGTLVDADMDEASSRVTALTTAQQMGVQSLSIANTMASKVLILLQS